METTLSVRNTLERRDCGAALPERHRFLDATPGFEALDSDVRAELEGACSVRRYRPHEQVFDRDQAASDVYFVIRGRVRIVNYSLSGREIAFDDAARGCYFGETAVLDGGPRSAAAVAVAESDVAAMPGRVFIDAIVAHPPLALAVMQRLCGLIRAGDQRIMDLSTLAASHRVQAELLRRAQLHRIDMTVARITPIPLHGEIASRVGTSRESVARVLNDLARKGMVKRTTDALIVRDLGRLERMVESVRG